MKNKAELVRQCTLAFDFVQKLYFEASYLIKEIEGILDQEGFMIGRPSGYQISMRGSAGLEPTSVNLWLLRSFGVFFAPKEQMAFARGQTTLSIQNKAKVLYLRVLLDGKDMKEPLIYSGVLYNIKKKQETKWPVKFEQAMQHIEYNDDKMFSKDLSRIDYEDACIQFNGHLFASSLFEINDSKTIVEKIVKPSVSLFNKY